MNENQQTDGTATASAPRPVIYVRSATNEDGQLQQRVEDARELAHMNGLAVATSDITAEHGSGANIHRRPGIQRILEQAARGEISHLVTPRISNLSRDYHDLHRVLMTLAEAGVTVVTDRGIDVYEMEHRSMTAMLTAGR